MEDGKDTTTSLLLCMGEALAKYEREVDDARDEVFLLMIKESTESAWMSLYSPGTTKLLECNEFNESVLRTMLHRFAQFYSIPSLHLRAAHPSFDICTKS
ncbi:hypothetical protein F442_15378 [Phytophthora nicotianae P10297]|uniref:Uncharacterized protein n=1 Tax=Phytophthora nicotianae P10297 TaxID=1317064 RepID=W2YQ60_PHYNI|nr:hypothetical protein F442_15378 [Phytophthora nicotianae P10297]